ncbi:DinB family protein [uncultured Maribacter sp.]|uniref:DinB family protein n=1 Tax=uncultured Maribacter sp. TaxID=431308 RepID=UPI0030DC6D55|tara:strand:- start:419 stop:901 length:483 start_codon:yes stop_codon:yes gene_type:complete
MDTYESIQGLAEFSSEIRKITLERLQEVPEGFFNWRLNNTAMSFGHILKHLIEVDELFFSLGTSKENQFQWELGSEQPNIDLTKHTYETKILELKKNLKKRYTAICILDDFGMNKEVADKNGKKMSFWWFIMRNVLEHEIYHTGQIAAYLKVLKGESSEI